MSSMDPYGMRTNMNPVNGESSAMFAIGMLPAMGPFVIPSADPFSMPSATNPANGESSVMGPIGMPSAIAPLYAVPPYMAYLEPIHREANVPDPEAAAHMASDLVARILQWKEEQDDPANQVLPWWEQPGHGTTFLHLPGPATPPISPESPQAPCPSELVHPMFLRYAICGVCLDMGHLFLNCPRCAFRTNLVRRCARLDENGVPDEKHVCDNCVGKGFYVADCDRCFSVGRCFIL
jgi:hypothetical protein